MSSCAVCSDAVPATTLRCTDCSELYCSTHREPAAHGCPARDDGDADGGDEAATSPEGETNDAGNDGGRRPQPSTPTAAAGDVTGDDRGRSEGSSDAPHCPNCGATITEIADVTFTDMGSKVGFVKASKRFYEASCAVCDRTIGAGVAGASSG